MKRRRHWTTRLGTGLLAVWAAVLLIHTTTLTQVSVTTAAFAPYFQAGDHLLVYRWAYGWLVPWSMGHTPQRLGSGTPTRGHWVLLYDPADTTANVTHRRQLFGQVKAVAGDTLALWLPNTERTPSDSTAATWQMARVPAKYLIGRVLCVSYHTPPEGGIAWERTFAPLPE